MRVDYLGLQAFVSIAEQGSFRQAAAHLNISQTALSHRMRKFEEYLGVKLMTRSARTVTLTPAGRELLPNAQRALSGLEETLDGLRRQDQPGQRELSIGCLPTLANFFLPPIIKTFSAAHPGLMIRIHDNSVAEIAQKVENGEAELGVTILSINHYEVDVQTLLREPFVVVAPADHPFAQHDSVDTAGLSGYPLVRISSQAGNRQLIDDALRNRNDLDWRYEVQHVSTAINLVLAGNGITIVPRLSVQTDLPLGIVVRPLRNPGITRLIGVIRRRGSQPTPAAQDLVLLLRKGAEQLKGAGLMP
jgi:DNA-binding transcriptional LysR family regulator